MYIQNDYSQNYPFCRWQLVVELKCFDTQPNEQTNKNLIKVPKVFEPINIKMILKLGLVYEYLNVPSLPAFYTYFFKAH